MDHLKSVKLLTEKLQLSPVSDLPVRKMSTASVHNRRVSDVDEVFTSGRSDSLSPLDDAANFSMSRRLLRIHRKSRDEQKRPLSVAKSVPMSPINSEEKLQQKLHDLHMNTDLITSELMAMRKLDQELARTFLKIYADIRVLKVKKSCMRHSLLLDEAVYETEMADEFSYVCDSLPKYMSKELQNRGVTRMNIHARRFSCS